MDGFCRVALRRGRPVIFLADDDYGTMETAGEPGRVKKPFVAALGGAPLFDFSPE
jgi:hypothetical protein